LKKKTSWVKGNPAIEHRIVHIDLKGPKIPIKSFYWYLNLLSRWGINGVLVEYEHRIPYLPLPNQFPPSDRYTKQEIRDLVGYSKNLGIEWIPLIQSFGHVEYLSRIKGTKILFEDPDYPQQLCPSKKQVKQYLKELIEIVCELHPESRYIHVGQDETHQLGLCPLCRKKVEKIGKIVFYLEHTNLVWDYVRSNGKIPMFWADMFFTENRPDLLKKIEEDVIPVVWQYDDTGETSCYAQIGGVKPSKINVKHPYKITQSGRLVYFAGQGDFFEDLPEKIKKLIGINEKTGYPRSFSQIRVAANFNKNLWITCAVYNCSDMLFMPDFVRGVFNPISMCKLGKKLGIKGIIASSWARAHSFAPISPPWTLTLYNLANFAAASYNGKTSQNQIKERMEEIAKEIGMPYRFGEFSLDDILWVISGQAPGPGVLGRVHNLEYILKILRTEKLKSIFGKGLIISVEAELLFTKLLFLEEEARWWNPAKEEIPSILKQEIAQRFSVIKKEIKKLKISAFKYYTGFVGDEKSFELWWKGLFEFDLYVVEESIKFLNIGNTGSDGFS